jgi:hypothetical protein
LERKEKRLATNTLCETFIIQVGATGHR